MINLDLLPDEGLNAKQNEVDVCYLSCPVVIFLSNFILDKLLLIIQLLQSVAFLGMVYYGRGTCPSLQLRL